MPSPVVCDPKLYEKAKTKYADMKHSAYKSSLIVQEYKRLGGKYKGKKPVRTGLVRWHKEKWRNQDGEVGYTKKGDIYRPTVRVNSKTPTTIHELSRKEIDAGMRKKKLNGRVNRFKSEFKGGSGPDPPIKIINPVTGRLVLKNGSIGRKIVKVKGVFPSVKSYKAATNMWDRWAAASDRDRQNVSKKYWDPRLNDQKVGVYPIYLKTYVPVLRKALKLL
jgi:hypothetical protein